jgi:hypothetical protein
VEAAEPGATFTAVFVALGATPALVALAAAALAITGRVDAASQRPVALIALGVLGGGSFLFLFFGFVALESATTGRDAADNLPDDLFFALLQSGPVLLYSAAAAIVLSAVGRPAPVRYRSSTGESY